MPTTTSTTPKENRVKAKRPSSEQRQQAILDAARLLLSEEGYDQLSLRKVAAKVGIHLKTLQHYFPTKEELIQSVLEYTHSLYDTTYEELRPKSKNPAEHFEKSIDYLINDDKDKQSAGFFYQLWARAHVDEHAKGVMHSMYSRHCENIANLMEPLNPDMDAQTRKERATMIAAMIEGMMLIIGYGKKRPEGIDNIEEQMLCLAKKLASDPDLLKP